MLVTGERFVRRLIAERRIRFHKIGRHVHSSSTDLDAFVAASTVEPVPLAVGRRRADPAAPWNLTVGHVTDTWERTVDGRRVRTDRYGAVRRWLARYEDLD